MENLLPPSLLKCVLQQTEFRNVTEIRLRINRPAEVLTLGGRARVKTAGGYPYVVKRSDIDFVLGVASDFSVYAVNDKIVRGYLSHGGVRIGVCGVGVSEGDKLLSVTNPNYLALRFPHEVKGCAERILRECLCADGVKNTLVISPPGAGKTTMLRDMARCISNGYTTLIIDERLEIAAVCDGVPTLDVGDADVLSGVKKSVAYENAVRAMNPEVIVTDELFRQDDILAMEDIVRSGVKVIASVHAPDFETIENSTAFYKLTKIFDCFAVLSKSPKIGTLVEIRGGR